MVNLPIIFGIMNEFTQIRREIRLLSQGKKISRAKFDYEEKIDEKSYIFRFDRLMVGDSSQIPYFVRFFCIDDPNILVDAIQSQEKLFTFLKGLLLCNREESFSGSLLILILLQDADNIDLSFFCDPNILGKLTMNLCNENYSLRINSLIALSNFLVDYPNIYDFLSQINFVGNLLSVADFGDESEEYKESFGRLDECNREISYALFIIEKEKLFKKEECPKLWEISIYLILSGTSEAIERGIRSLAILSNAGYLGNFSEEVMDYLAICVCDGIDILKSFLYFLRNIPNREEFFVELCHFGLLENIIMIIRDDIRDNAIVLYEFLGDIQFVENDTQILLQTSLELLQNGRFKTRVSIIYYFYRILNTSSADLMKKLIENDIMSSIMALISSEDPDAILKCLNFLENFFFCFKSMTNQSITSIPNSDALLDFLSDLITKIDDNTDEKIHRILAFAE